MGGGLRPFGATGLAVPLLGLGAGSVGDGFLDEDEAARLLHGALDLGLTFVDTAPGYGLSEERIGRHLSSRRSSFVLSTKLGYGVPGVPDWTPECIARGVDQALSRLRTDVLDVAHLHSCPLETLLSSGVVEALLDAVRAGKVRVAAYSGENEALAWAVSSGAFGSVQCSVNVCDQRSLALLSSHDLGVVAKRPLANTPWNPSAAHPDDAAAAAYRLRWAALRLDALGLPPAELAIRFAAFAPGVSTAIVGSRRLEHLAEMHGHVAKGPLSANVRTEVEAHFAALGTTWQGMI
ncbi:MAG TPA: aldo/keto reductase [Thermoanaerobaculia bacterium]|nr:aldo/keto reductase [Thermoanaerobaculia bacterium]